MIAKLSRADALHVAGSVFLIGFGAAFAALVLFGLMVFLGAPYE